jgi:hypothetical protein
MSVSDIIYSMNSGERAVSGKIFPFLERFSFLPMPYYGLFVSSGFSRFLLKIFWVSKNHFKTMLTRISIQSLCKFMANEEISLCESSD